jgi:hypothetical protein
MEKLLNFVKVGANVKMASWIDGEWVKYKARSPVKGISATINS